MRPWWIGWAFGWIAAIIFVGFLVTIPHPAEAKSKPNPQVRVYDMPDDYPTIYSRCLPNGDRIYLTKQTTTDYGDGAAGLAVVAYPDQTEGSKCHT